jgi:hypothetical protein
MPKKKPPTYLSSKDLNAIISDIKIKKDLTTGKQTNPKAPVVVI